MNIAIRAESTIVRRAEEPLELMPATSDAGGGLLGAFDAAAAFAKKSKAENTLRGYADDWNTFTFWCTSHGIAALPAAPETVALYIAALANGLVSLPPKEKPRKDRPPREHKVATIARHMASISKMHQAAGFDSPSAMRHAAVSETWKGIRRTKGTAQTAKTATSIENLRNMVNTITKGNGLIDVRDRALLLIGFAGAFRRSELVALTIGDIEFNNDGVTAIIRRSKTDQEGGGRKVGIPYGSDPATCPVRSLQAWLEAAGVTEGPLFRWVDRHGNIDPQRRAHLKSQVVARVVKKRAEAANLKNPETFSGHSLRAGLATAAAIAGKSERAIMLQTGHKSSAMVRRYIRDGSLFRENAASGIGL